MHEPKVRSMFLVVDNERKKHLDWVTAILEKRNWRPNRLATEAGVDPSSLSRFLNDASGKRTLNSYSIEKIARASGFEPFELEPQGGAVVAGLSENDGEAYKFDQPGDVSAAVQAIKRDRNGIDAWTLKSRALEMAGYIPGDILVIDLNAAPKPGDVVCAQVYDRTGTAETVLRLYDGTFLLAATMDPRLMTPILVDRNVIVRGVVISSLRERRAA